MTCGLKGDSEGAEYIQVKYYIKELNYLCYRYLSPNPSKPRIQAVTPSRRIPVLSPFHQTGLPDFLARRVHQLVDELGNIFGIGRFAQTRPKKLVLIDRVKESFN